MDPRYFVDVSNYTIRFRAHRYAQTGALLVGVLCTDGEAFYSDKHAEQAAHAHEAGLIVWHYHFCRPELDPLATGEAAHFWRHAKPHYQPGDRLVLDLERRHPAGLGALCAYLHAVDDKLHAISGVAAVGYTFDSLLRETGAHLQVKTREWWIAKPDGVLWPLRAGRRCIARQVRLDGYGKGPDRVPGVDGLDVDQLARWYHRRLVKERRRRRVAPHK